MTKNRPADAPAPEAPLSLEKAEKGSRWSMWELLLQMRILLPYLARLVPLIDRGLLKTSPDFSELNKSLADMQTGNRELEVQARNQALQLERIEQQMGRLRVAHEQSIEESRRLFAEVRSLRRSLFAISIVVVVLLLVSVGMLAFLTIHS